MGNFSAANGGNSLMGDDSLPGFRAEFQFDLVFLKPALETSEGEKLALEYARLVVVNRKEFMKRDLSQLENPFSKRLIDFDPHLLSPALMSGNHLGPRPSGQMEKASWLAEELFIHHLSDKSADGVLGDFVQAQREPELRELLLNRTRLAPRGVEYFSNYLTQIRIPDLEHLYARIASKKELATPLLPVLLQPRLEFSENEARIKAVNQIVATLKASDVLKMLDSKGLAPLVQALSAKEEFEIDWAKVFLKMLPDHEDPKFIPTEERSSVVAQVLQYFVSHSSQLSPEIWKELQTRIHPTYYAHPLSPLVEEPLMILIRELKKSQGSLPAELEHDEIQIQQMLEKSRE